MKGKLDIYCDEEGDFLEITILNPPKKSYCEDISNGVFVRKDEKTDDIMGVGILSFKARTKNIRNVKIDLPLEINITQPARMRI